MLVPLVKFFSLNLKPTYSQRVGVRKWFWNCAFKQRYKAGTNKLVKEDMDKMTKLAAGEPVFDGLESEIDASLFKKTWRINLTAAKAAICLLAQYKPLSFLTGAPVDLGNVLAAYNAREFHHIYPKAFLGANGIPFHESNVIANVCFLTSADNNVIRDRDPREYLSEIPASSRDEIFASALVPLIFADGSRPYAEFINQRAEKLASAARELIENGQPRSSSSKGHAPS